MAGQAIRETSRAQANAEALEQAPARFRRGGLRLIVECGASAALDLQYARKRRGTVREVYVAAVQALAPSSM
jgi:hypothetical protein